MNCKIENKTFELRKGNIAHKEGIDPVVKAAPYLPGNFIIHGLAVMYGRNRPEAQLLTNCYKNSLQLAEDKGVASLAFPAITTAAFGNPINEAEAIAIDAIFKIAPKLNAVKPNDNVLHSRNNSDVYATYLNQKNQG